MVQHGGPGDDSALAQEGQLPGLSGQGAFARGTWPAAMPVLIAVPHAGRSYPPALMQAMRHPDAASLRLEDRHADLVARAVARETGAALLLANAPRAMIDLNRAPDDVDWGMVSGAWRPVPVTSAAGRRARSGLGLVPRRLQGLGEVWRGALTAQDLEERLDQVHRPYHAALSTMLQHLRDRWGAALLLDLHSMPPLSQRGQEGQAPRFVIGDRFGTSCGPALAAAALEHLAAARQPVAHNRPYAGGYVLDRHGAPARGIHALQLEICRRAYLDSHLRDPGPGLPATVALVVGMVRRLAAELAGQSLPQAAE